MCHPIEAITCQAFVLPVWLANEEFSRRFEAHTLARSLQATDNEGTAGRRQVGTQKASPLVHCLMTSGWAKVLEHDERWKVALH